MRSLVLIKNLKKVFDILEFDKILNMLLKHTSCEETKLLVENIMPKTNLDEVEKNCSKTDEVLV